MKVYTYNSVNKMLSGSHLLIGGTTGSGKTVLINTIIYQLIQQSPSETKLILIDPKRVGLYKFRKLPHVISYQTSDGAAKVLDYVIKEMESRYKKILRGKNPKYKLYVIIDELADLMLTSKKDVMPKLQRILQLGRESDIHIISATQCPNRRIIPAELTLNFTERVALRCISSIESRQIIGCGGAESLPGYGSGLLLCPDGVLSCDIPMIDSNHLDELIRYWKPKWF